MFHGPRGPAPRVMMANEPNKNPLCAWSQERGELDDKTPRCRTQGSAQRQTYGSTHQRAHRHCPTSKERDEHDRRQHKRASRSVRFCQTDCSWPICTGGGGIVASWLLLVAGAELRAGRKLVEQDLDRGRGAT